MSNEAAERLLRRLIKYDSNVPGSDLSDLAKEALAAERRATVERIRDQFLPADYVTPSSLEEFLDAEAER